MLERHERMEKGHSMSSGPILEFVPTRPSPILLKFCMKIHKHTGGRSVKF